MVENKKRLLRRYSRLEPIPDVEFANDAKALNLGLQKTKTDQLPLKDSLATNDICSSTSEAESGDDSVTMGSAPDKGSTSSVSATATK